jgi:glutamine synthetase
MEPINQSQIIEVVLCFNDISGQSKQVTISCSDLNFALSNGIKVDGSDIIGLTGICESEFILWPISNTKRLIKTRNNSDSIMYDCKVTTQEGVNVQDIAEELLQNTLQEAQILGFHDLGKSQLINILFPNTTTIALQYAS